MNVALGRVLYAHALVGAPRMALGRLAPLGRLAGSPNPRTVSSMKRELKHFLRDESGEDLIEYGLLVAFVAALATLIVVSDPMHLSHALKKVFQDVGKALDKAGK